MLTFGSKLDRGAVDRRVTGYEFRMPNTGDFGYDATIIVIYNRTNIRNLLLGLRYS